MQQHLLWSLAFLLAVLNPVQSTRQLRDSSNLPSAWTTGIATNYGGPSEGKDPYSPSFGTSEGSCGYGELDKSKYPYWSVAALSPSNPFYVAGPTGGCGQCFEVQCVNSGGQYAGRCNSDPSQRSVTVMISDVCPECESNHIDIQALTYNKMAPMLGGRIDMRYRRVECTPPSNLIVNIEKNSGTGGFLKMSVTTAGGSGGISTVQVKGGNAGWKGLQNKYGGMWELDTQPQLPLDIRIVADSGQEVAVAMLQLTALGVIDKSGQTGNLPTGVQFSFDGPPSFDEASSIGSSDSDSASASASASASSSDSSNGSSEGSASSSPSSDASSSPEDSSDSSSIQQNIALGSGEAAGSSSSSDGASASAGEDQVSAFDGPAPASKSPKASSPSSKGVSPSASPKASSPSGKGSSPRSPGSSSSSSGNCKDVSPGKNSCSQEKAWGHCSSSWMKQASSSNPKGYCAKTCGRC
ncbi:expansin-like protein [Trebouxia sp. C0010 RCD-2024]